MANKAGKKGKYRFKLGPGASIFYDPQSKVKVTPNKITEFEGRMTSRLRIALTHGHIIELGKAEAKELQSRLDDGQIIFSSANKGTLVKYYEENYDVSDAEVQTFASYKKDKMVEVLEDLADNADSDDDDDDDDE